MDAKTKDRKGLIQFVCGLVFTIALFSGADAYAWHSGGWHGGGWHGGGWHRAGNWGHGNGWWGHGRGWGYGGWGNVVVAPGVGYYGARCAWIGGHYNRYGNWIRPHRNCW